MFQVSVEREFCAAHAILIRGIREPVHGHNFRLTVTVEADRLDDDGLLVDFHALQQIVDDIIRPWTNADLNAQEPFTGAQGRNPTAEYIAQSVAERVMRDLPPRPDRTRIKVASVRITEAPGCVATYFPPSSPVPGNSGRAGLVR